MNPNKTFSVLLLIAGELLIIISFFYFGRNLDTNLLVLNIIVSLIIYSLFFIDILIPMVDFKDKSQKTIGSIGLRWFFTLLYTLTAIGVMVIFNEVKPIDINSQIIIHAILIFFLSLGIYFAVSSSTKVNKVFLVEEQNLSHMDEMKKATMKVQLKLEQINNIPNEIISRITTLQENLRFISPCDNPKAFELETKYLNEMNAVQDCLFNIPINYKKIIEIFQNCEKTYNERKQIFSN